MNRPLFYVSILLIIISFIILPSTIARYRLSKNPNYIEVKVIKLPNCSAGYRNKLIKILFDNITYTFRTKCKFVTGINAGQSIIMNHEPGSTLFLFPNEDQAFELMSVFGIGMIGVVCIIKSKMKKEPDDPLETISTS